MIASSFLHFLALRFDVSTIVEIRVVRAATEDSLAATPPLVLADQQTLVSGFQLLTTMTRYQRYKEHLLDGYRFDIRLQGESAYGNHSIMFYRATTARREPMAVVVIPGFGEWNCPAFGRWIQTHIEQDLPAP